MKPIRYTESMHEHELISLVLFSGFFFFTTSILHNTTKRFTLLPYTSALLLVGLITQLLVHQFGFQTELALSPNVIYYILLPLLLFESAMHINLHQFKLQFKTIAFLATFGLLISMMLIGVSLSVILHLPLAVGLLFGTIISATDPIAVLALFKSLGAPKRLGLLAEGESMFNDATAVIAFRTMLVFAMGAAFEANHLAVSLGEFFYVSLGSAVVGGVLGYIIAQIIARINNDRLVETTLTIGLALSSFVIAEHYFHFSGVISTVVAAIVMGNLGRTKISGGVITFMGEFWEYIGFVAISLVFFFATFNLNMEIFNANLLGSAIVILIMLIGRAISVYLSFYITNRSGLFKDEPNVPLKWQHIINWGGMRGVIPLVLVYSLPADFAYKQDFLSFTVSAFLFTLFVNAVSIKTLLTFLGVHLPKTEDSIIRDEEQLLELVEAQEEIKDLPTFSFDQKIVRQTLRKIKAEEAEYKKHLLEKGGYKNLLKGLKLQALRLEGNSFQRLFYEGSINETVYFDLESELDLQLDALEYPEVADGRAYDHGGFIHSNSGFRYRLKKLEALIRRHPLLSKFFGYRETDLIENRMSLLKARILSSQDVIEHMRLLKHPLAGEAKAIKAINKVIDMQETLILRNQNQLDQIEADYPKITSQFQSRFLTNLVKAHTSEGQYTH